MLKPSCRPHGGEVVGIRVVQCISRCAQSGRGSFEVKVLLARIRNDTSPLEATWVGSVDWIVRYIRIQIEVIIYAYDRKQGTTANLHEPSQRFDSTESLVPSQLQPPPPWGRPKSFDSKRSEFGLCKDVQRQNSNCTSLQTCKAAARHHCKL